MWRFHVWGQSRLRPSFILFKNCFQIHSGSVQVARRNHRSDQPAQWARRGKPGEEDDDPPPPPSSLTGSTKHHLLYPQRAHTHNFQFSWEHVDTHTHFTLSLLTDVPFPSDRAENPNYTTVATSKPSLWPSISAFLSIRSAFNLIHPSAKSKAPQFNFSIKLTQKQMTNMVQMFHFITFVKRDKNKYK